MKRSKLCVTGYAAIVRTVIDGPTRIRDVSAKHGLTPEYTRLLLNWMVDLELIHESLVRKEQGVTGTKHFQTVYFSFGPGGRLSWPGRRPRGWSRPPVELISFRAAVQALQDREFSGRGLSDVSGISPNTVGRLVRTLHELKLTHIADHTHNHYPMYAWGVDQKDVAKPRAISRTPGYNHRVYVQSIRRKTDAALLGILRQPEACTA